MLNNALNDFWYEIDVRLTDDDISFCRDISARHIDSVSNEFFSSATGKKQSYIPSYQSYFFKDSEDDYSHHPLFGRIASVLKYTKKHWDYKEVYARSQVAKISGNLKPHIDYRSCVITVPIKNVVYPIHWYSSLSDQEPISTYDYKGMVLINTSIPHGCLENDLERVLFQIGGFGSDEPFQMVRDSIIKRMSELENK